jgi:hypothetical protein
MVATNMEQFRPTPTCPSSFHGDRQRLPLSNKYDQTFTARYSRIHEVPLQHRVTLSTEGNYDGWTPSDVITKSAPLNVGFHISKRRPVPASCWRGLAQIG